MFGIINESKYKLQNINVMLMHQYSTLNFKTINGQQYTMNN